MPASSSALSAPRRRHIRRLVALWCVGTGVGLAGCATGGRDLGTPPAQIPPPIAERLRAIGPVIDPPETAKLYAPSQLREPYAGVQVQRDLRYGPDARNLLDVFVPAGGGRDRPVFVFVHGGGFIAGNKRTGDSPFYDNIALWAVSQGMVAVNLTYRLAPAHPWPAAQEDLRGAVGWVLQNITARGGDPRRVFLAGHSAGAAHVALYVAQPQFHDAPGSGLAGALLLSGVYDIAPMGGAPSTKAYFGDDASRYAERSSVAGLAKTPVPLFVQIAELDPPPFHTQADTLRAALCQAGRCPTWLRLAGHSHMSEVYAINTPDRVLSDAMAEFVRRNGGR